MSTTVDAVVVGGGIVGLATARALLRRDPAARVVLVEKERGVARHQSGRNSGVIHSGLYYRPGSLKARTCIAGNRSMVAYARARDIPVEVTGKLVVATRRRELPGLRALHERGLAHGLPVRWLTAAEARRVEPDVAAISALHVATTGVVDYAEVARALAREVVERDGEVRTGCTVRSLHAEPGGAAWRVGTDEGELRCRRFVNCGGLHSDELAVAAGLRPRARIIPFRGEYHELRPDAASLVRGLVYPVPDPDFPFLGVHLTRGIDGTVHAGPNAVLALAREGYRWRDVDPAEVRSILEHRGFRRLARAHLRQGLAEMGRSAWRPLFLRALQRLVPDLRAEDLVRSPAGVRAQAVDDRGALLDDFVLETQLAGGAGPAAALHVVNAPSPAATASLEIGEEIARRLPG